MPAPDERITERMMRSLLALLLALAPGLVAAQGTPQVTRGEGPDVPFHCPAAGVVVQDDAGGTRRYQGADPADPLVCLVRYTPRGRSELSLRLLGGIFAQGDGARGEARRAAAAALLPWRVGTVVKFSTPGQDGLLDDIEWEVAALTQVNVPAGDFQTLTILERARTRGPDGAPAQGSFIHRIDAATGVFLAYAGEIQHAGRSTRAVAMTARSITTP